MTEEKRFLLDWEVCAGGETWSGTWTINEAKWKAMDYSHRQRYISTAMRNELSGFIRATVRPRQPGEYPVPPVDPFSKPS